LFRFLKELIAIETNPPPGSGDGSADYALVFLHCLRIYLNTSYRTTIDIPKEMTQIAGEIGLNPVDLPALSTLCKVFDRI